MRDHIASERTLAADVQTIGALHIALNLTHDDEFFSVNACCDVALSTDGDPVIRKTEGAFHATVDEKRFGAAYFALNHERASDSGLLHGCRSRLDWSVAVGGGRWRILRFRRLEHFVDLARVP